jgi:hypothetical protein
MKNFTFLVFLFIIQNAHSQGIGIGSTNPPHPSAALDVNSTNKGLLIPRMTTTQRVAIASPLKGLLVFDNTTSSFWFYNGTAWEQASLNNQWAINGSNISYSGGRVGVGTNNPQARMAVDSSLMIDQSNSNQGFLDKSSLYFGSDKKVGIIRSFLNGSNGRSGLGFFTNSIRRMTIDSTGQVGIGTINPLQTLHVSGNTYLNGYLGIGTSSPIYTFQNLMGMNHMSYNLGVGVVPTFNYMLDVSGNDPSRFQGQVIINGVLNPTTTLIIGNNATVAGTLAANSNATVAGTLAVNSNATVDGSLTVNNGKGVAYNTSSATNLKMFPFTTLTFGAVLPGFGLSAEGAIVFGGGFTSTPRVFVGDIDATSGTLGELYRVQLQLYGCSTTSGTTTCKARLLNTSPNPVNYNITWNCMAIGY